MDRRYTIIIRKVKGVEICGSLKVLEELEKYF